MQYGELYHKNYYREVKDKNRVYYEFYHLDGTENVPEDYKEISFVCLRPDGSLELPSTLGTICRKIAQKLDGFEGFHFHQLRHTYTSNLLANGAAPQVTYLMHDLAKKGIPVDLSATTVAEARDSILKAFK